MPFVKTERIEFYYQMKGDGKNLLFISGTGGDLRLSPNAFDNNLKDNFRLLTYDQRGLGQTQIPDGPYTMKDYADDAFSLINKLGWKETCVIGVSFGGMVAQHLAIRHPHQVKKLVLMCTSPGGKNHSYPLHELEDLDKESYVKKFISISDDRITKEFIKKNPDMYEMLFEQFMQYIDKGNNNKGKLLQLEARKHHDTNRDLHKINCPTLIAGGLYDQISPMKNLLALDNLIPTSSVKFFKGGHSFFLQDGTAWATIIEFLKDDSDRLKEAN